MLEKKIKENLEEYEIKTKSNLILARYNEECHKKPKSIFSFSKTKALSVALSLSIIVLALVLVVIKVNDTTTPQLIDKQGLTEGLKDESVFGEVSMELYYGCMVSFDSNNRNIRYKKNITQDDFTKAVNEIDKKMKLIDMLYLNKEGLSYSYKNVEFDYNGIRYNYLLSVEGFDMYCVRDIANKENQDIIIEVNGSYYDGKIKYETEEDEVEMKLSYNINGETIKIEKEYEGDEFSYKYQRTKDEIVIELIKLEIESEENLEVSLKHQVEENQTVIKIEYEDQYIIDYSCNEISLKGITVEEKDGRLIYKYEDLIIEK